MVDDSSFARLVVSRQLNSAPDIDVVGTASDGEQGLAQVIALEPDVITLDVEMPKMDGLTTLRRIMEERPTPVIMLSSLTSQGADVTLQALELGAVDFFLKQSSANPAGPQEAAEQLRDKVRASAKVRRVSLRPGRVRAAAPRRTSTSVRSRAGRMDHIVVIGSSTGGPRALAELLPAIPKDIPAAFVVVQHMPAGFTASLASRLDGTSEIKVKEAAEGDRLGAGEALVAPGGSHLKVQRTGEVLLLHDVPPVHGVKPSIDVTMKSVVEMYGSTVVGVVLTGMGVDGAAGSGLIKRSGGSVLAEDESTCAVFGMSAAVIDGGFADRVVPIHEMAEAIVAVCSAPVGR